MEDLKIAMQLALVLSYTTEKNTISAACRTWEKFYQVVWRLIPGPIPSGAIAETCIACFYSNQNVDKKATLLRLTNSSIAILATALHLQLRAWLQKSISRVPPSSQTP